MGVPECSLDEVIKDLKEWISLPFQSFSTVQKAACIVIDTER